MKVEHLQCLGMRPWGGGGGSGGGSEYGPCGVDGGSGYGATGVRWRVWIWGHGRRMEAVGMGPGAVGAGSGNYTEPCLVT